MPDNSTLDILRTDDERFESLKDWPYQPHYISDLEGYSGMRAHYLDEGPIDSEHIFLCLHGEPSWSYLYRHMIPIFTASGGRVIAPDFFGFGRSDKPMDDSTYTWDFHRNFLLRFIERLDLKNITLVCQDWGGLLGLTLPVDMPERFKRLIVMNTTIATGRPAGEGFNAWRAYVANTPDLDVGALMKRSTAKLSQTEIDAYNAPFPDARYKAGVRRFPAMVMTEPEMDGVEISKAAVDFWKNHWTGQSFMAIGHQDPVLGPPAMYWLASVIKNCPPPLDLPEAGHFVQEWGDQVAHAALSHFQLEDKS